MRSVRWIDSWLDSITMYRLLLYYLIALLLAAFGLSWAGVMHYNPLSIACCALLAVAMCRLTNGLFSRVFAAPTNVESAYITALILALIIAPSLQPNGLLFLAVACSVAMASKYMLAINHKHIFNPAAIAVVLTGFGAGDAASWWVGTAPLLPFVVAGGLLVARKLRRTAMVAVFVSIALAVTTLLAIKGGGSAIMTLQKEAVNSALLFVGFVMLTEPLTAPTTKKAQLWYAALAGLLISPQVHVLNVFSTPELALIAGNMFAYIVGPRVKTFLHFTKRIPLSHDTFDFVFTPARRFTYKPGQYMEYTLQHPCTDARGARRYFTLASSPTEPTIRLGVKFYKNGSSYKRALLSIGPSTPIVAAQLSGDFILPKNKAQKIAFIAGGIGITPYRSMLKYLADINQARPITLLYAARTPADFVYKDVLDTASRQLGVKVVYIATEPGIVPQPGVYAAQLTPESIRQHIPDYAERLFYISGPHGMVVAAEATLRLIGVPARHIKKDFFPGYA